LLCSIEGNDAPNYWKWSNTVRPLANRTGRPSTWGYQNTDGVGLVEFIHWCEDLNIEPGEK
jgi:alpha-N-arabinofuranosidase